jgi:hypothetical protein
MQGPRGCPPVVRHVPSSAALHLFDTSQSRVQSRAGCRAPSRAVVCAVVSSLVVVVLSMCRGLSSGLDVEKVLPVGQGQLQLTTKQALAMFGPTRESSLVTEASALRYARYALLQGVVECGVSVSVIIHCGAVR